MVFKIKGYFCEAFVKKNTFCNTKLTLRYEVKFIEVLVTPYFQSALLHTDTLQNR